MVERVRLHVKFEKDVIMLRSYILHRFILALPIMAIAGVGRPVNEGYR